MITPQGAIDAGALWRIDGVLPWYSSGQIASGIAAGPHTVSFTDPPCWDPPSPENITVVAGQTTVLNASYAQGGNQSPSAIGASVSTPWGVPAAIMLQADDPDNCPEALTYEIVSEPVNGLLTGSDQNRTYTPNPGFVGIDQFTFRAFDGLAYSNDAVVDISATNQAPTADAQVLSVSFESPTPITLTGSDSDSGPQPLAFQVETQPSNGGLSGIAPNLNYTPDNCYVGPDSFTFSVSDGAAQSAPATVSVTLEMPPGRTDCNSNNLEDACEVAGGAQDCNSNLRPDDCDVRGDFDGDGMIDIDDIAGLVSALLDGACATLADIDQNGIANGLDIQHFLLGIGQSPSLQRRIYVTDFGFQRIFRLNDNGSSVEPVVAAGFSSPGGILFDPDSQKIYWSDRGTGNIERANPDGSSREVVRMSLEHPNGIAIDASAGKIYWCSAANADRIQRANVDGSGGIEDLANAGNEPVGIALDIVNQKVYWVAQAARTINRANLDGSAPETLQTLSAGSLLNGIAVDSTAGKIYVSDQGTHDIQWGDLDGSNMQSIVTGLGNVVLITLDLSAGKLYWVEHYPTDKIQRANLDGSNPEPIAESGFSDLYGIAIGYSLVPNSLWWRYVVEIGSWPSPRRQPAMAVDTARDRVVLFGGAIANDNTASDETWEWNGANWIGPFTGGPSARTAAAMAYDASRQVSVLFGGYSGNYNAETWEWDGATWVQRFPSTSPTARYSHTMAFDTIRDRVILFGGFSGGNNGDTWEWDGNNWVELSPSGQPSLPTARSNQAMTYDIVRNRIVMFGGHDGTLQSDTWEYDGAVGLDGSWTQVQQAGPMEARQAAAMAFDPMRHRTVLFGGQKNSGFFIFDDTWEWDGETWSQPALTYGPSGRASPAMGFDSMRQSVLIFGGGGPNADQLSKEQWEFGDLGP